MTFNDHAVLPQFHEILAKTKKVNWKFHVTGTFRYPVKDPFAVEHCVLKYLSKVAQVANEPVKTLEWFLRVEEHESTNLHAHLLIGSFKLIEPSTNVAALELRLARFWEWGICSVTDVSDSTLRYVCKPGLPHFLYSKRVRKIARQQSS